MASKYSIGLDYGTSSVRAVVVDVRDGRTLAESTFNYPHGVQGVVIDDRDPNIGRQHPADYIAGIEHTITDALERAATDGKFSKSDVIGIGVDTTGSSPLPIDAEGNALALLPKWKDDPNAMTWLWKDHTSYKQADKITELGMKLRPAMLEAIGKRYSSEWFWAKIWKCADASPAVFDAAYSWVEIADWIPAVLSGTTHPSKLKRGSCAAGHKALYSPNWGGYPDEEFIAALDPRLVRVRRSLPDKTYSVATPAGKLSAEWAHKLGLPEGIAVAVGAFDAHLGAVGAGIKEGDFVKVMGTSTCDIMVSPLSTHLKTIPGLCGIAHESVLPHYWGLEAGQSAVGDIFNWLVNVIQPGTRAGSEFAALTHDQLTEQAQKLAPGQSGLLTLDWHNGNRTVLVDQRLTGMILGLTLYSTPGEIYRSLIEATAFGSRVIVERFKEYGVPVKQIINCGGIAARNPLVMQIYADILNCVVHTTHSVQACAFGSAIAGAVVAGGAAGGYADFTSAMKAMVGRPRAVFTPDPKRAATYEKLFKLYRQLHDSFGVAGHKADISNVMKELLDIRDGAKSA